MPIFSRSLLAWLTALCLLTLSAALPSRADEPQTARLLLPLVMPAGGSAATRTATWSTPIALSPDGAEVWVVNPDADSVSVVDAGQLVKSDEILVGRSPWALAIARDGTQIYVINRGDGSLSIIDAASRQVWATIPVGPEPGGIALNRTGTQAYVTVTAANTVAVIDTAQLTVTATLPVAPLPYGVAVSAASRPDEQDERVLVTHLLAQPQADGIEGTDDGRTGWVSLLAVLPLQVAAVISLAPDEHGFPNLLTGIAVAGERAWLPHVRSAPALPNGLRTTVFAAVTAVDLHTLSEERTAYLPLNDEEVFGSPVNNPVAAPMER